jgi:integrase/recombinase XerD
MDIRVYLAAYTKTGVKNTTIATTISCLKSFFGWLETQDYINKSPMRKVKNIKIEKRLRKPLSQEELEMLRIACKTVREKAIVEFFYSTGCRLDEVYKLNKGDINWNTDSCMVIGKGNKERRVFLNAKARVHLWKYIASRKDNNEALFVTGRGKLNRLGPRSFEEIFGDLGRRAGLTKRVHPHLLRHTMATSMLNNGASLAAVQGLLGHEDPATTQIYAELNQEELHLTHKRHSA